MIHSKICEAYKMVDNTHGLYVPLKKKLSVHVGAWYGEEKEQLSEEKQQLQGVSDRYDRVVRVLGENVVEDAVQQDIQEQKALEEKRQVEQMPKGSIHERLAWGARKSEMENQQRKKNKTKNRGMER